jgi:porin
MNQGIWRIVLPVFGWLCAPQVHAQVAPAEPQATNAQHRDENGGQLPARQAAAKLTVTYTSDLNADVAGGDRRGATYLGRIGLIGDTDLDRLLGWEGATAHISIHAIHGQGLSGHRVGNLLTVSGLEAEPAFRLFNLWIEQKIGTRATLRVGQFTAAQEFAISTTASLFVNATFGWPASFAADLPSGGPSYPLAAPGLRLAVMPSDALTLRAAVFAGDPAGPGGGDPQRRDLHGLNGLRFAGKPFMIAEIVRTWGAASDPDLALHLGGWLHFDRFDVISSDASPPGRSRGNEGVYAMADTRVWRAGDRTLHAFARASWSPPDRNLIALYADGGLSLQGPVAHRPNDIVGLSLAYARISPRLRGLVRAQNLTTGTNMPLPSAEGVIEASYQLQLGGQFYLQPNAQYVINPAAGAPAVTTGNIAPVATDALVLGVRTSLRF